ncbi:MAG: tetratricopeptide repeat protein [Prosthecobacter sp.]|nr:tetratricopeptide repeat protein [Prosthecobacter sp.]
MYPKSFNNFISDLAKDRCHLHHFPMLPLRFSLFLNVTLLNAVLLCWLGWVVTASSETVYGPDLLANAEAGNAEAQYQLSRCYLLGKGVAEDDAAALAWEMKAAERNHPDAQFNLGARYYVGFGVKTELVQAGKWLALAAKAEHVKAKGMYDSVERALTAEQKAQMTKLIVEFRPAASTNPVVKTKLPPGMERASQYKLLRGEGGAGSGFIVRYYQFLCAVTSLHQFDGRTPARLEAAGQAPVLLNTGKVIRQKDVQAVQLADQKATIPSLDYNPKFRLEDHEAICVFDSSGKPHEAELYFLNLVSEYHSMEGPTEMEVRLKFPITAAGASGAPIIQLSTGLVIGVLLGADSPVKATRLSFETLCLPDLSPKPAPKPAPVYADPKQAAAYRDFTEFAKRVPSIHWNAMEKYLKAWNSPSFETLDEFVKVNRVSELEILPSENSQWEASLKLGDERRPNLFWKYQFVSGNEGGWTLKGGQKIENNKPMDLLNGEALMKRSVTSAFAEDAAKK